MSANHKHGASEYAAARQALSELAAIYHDVPIGLAVIGTDTRFQRINTRLAEINGLPAEVHIGRTVREVAPDLADMTETLIAKIVTTGEAVLNIEVEGETAAQPGVKRNWIEHWSPVKNSEGQITAVNVVVEEVTERKRTLKALQASETRLREVLDAIKDAFVVLDGEFRVITMNREALRLDGRPLEALVGHTHWELWPASNGTPLEAAYRKAMSERVSVALDHHYRSDQQDLWFDLAVYPSPDGIAVFYRDITEKKRSEDTLRDSERFLATALRAGRLGAYEYVFRPSPQYHWDKTVRGIWGIDAQEAITDDLFWSMVHPADRDKISTTIAQGCNPKGSHRYENEYRIYRRTDHALRWVRVDAEVVFDQGEPLKIIGIIQDITDRRLAQEKDHLLTREVNHRSKNLLSVVQSVARQMAKTNDPETFSDRFSERLQGLAASHDLLVHSQWRGVEIADLVKSQLDHYHDLIGSRIVLSGPSLRVSAAAAQTLGMALHELSTNAAKYGALSNTTGQLRITWSTSPAEDGDQFHMEWIERGGPPVHSTEHKGLGSRIITRLVEQALEATVSLNHATSGVQWTVTAPARNVIEQVQVNEP